MYVAVYERVYLIKHDRLTQCAGISGGQARRLTIGVEIINLPDLIFLDEPTTGLDSNISYEVKTVHRVSCLATVWLTRPPSRLTFF